MLNMIDNLLDSMKLRDGSIELVKSNFLLHDAVEEVLVKYKVDLESIKITKFFQDDCAIESDRIRVMQMIDNLISNSIKYCNNSIALVVRSNKEEFVLEFLDDGKGFADISKAFVLFSQSDEDNITRTAQGTGVGLFVVKKLCDIMGYSINIASSKNLGGARVVIKGKLK